MNVYILCITDTTRSKESICPAHLECGTEVAQRPHLPHLSNWGPGETSALGLVQQWKQGSKQNPTNKRDSVRKSFAPTPAPRIVLFGKVRMYFLYTVAPFFWTIPGALCSTTCTSLEVYPFLDVFPCSITPSWATVPSIPSLDVSRAKVSFGTVSQARSDCRKQEIHREREWKSWWKGVGHLLEGAKRTLHRENGGKKLRGEKEM